MKITLSTYKSFNLPTPYCPYGSYVHRSNGVKQWFLCNY